MITRIKTLLKRYWNIIYEFCSDVMIVNCVEREWQVKLGATDDGDSAFHYMQLKLDSTWFVA